MIDNFLQIKEFLTFDPENHFYFCQILCRKKDGNSSEFVAKTYYIRTAEDLDRNKEEMIMLAKLHNARVVINLNRRSNRTVAYQSMKEITDMLLNGEYKAVRKAYNKACGQYGSDPDKKWILDVDNDSFTELMAITTLVESLEPTGRKIKCFIKTKSGYHIITSPFNVQAFNKAYPMVEVKKDHPTVLYIP